MASLLLLEIPIGLSKSIAVPELPIFNPESVQHTVALKPLMSPGLGWELVVRTILDEHTREV